MANELKTVKLYGTLGGKFGREFQLNVSSPAEAIRALSSQVPGFEKYLMESKDNGLGFAVFIGTQNLTKDELRNPAGTDCIRIAPIILGSKSAGLFQIILGAVIIIASVVIDYFTLGAFGAATGYSTYIMGATMMLGGVIQLLSPKPKGPGAQDDVQNRASYNFNGTVNTQAQGNPVGLLYGGPLKIGSAVISASILARDEVYVPLTYGPGGTGGGGGPTGGGTGGGGSAPWHREWYDLDTL